MCEFNNSLRPPWRFGCWWPSWAGGATSVFYHQRGGHQGETALVIVHDFDQTRIRHPHQRENRVDSKLGASSTFLVGSREFSRKEAGDETATRGHV